MAPVPPVRGCVAVRGEGSLTSRGATVSQQINLYNPIFLKQRKHFSAVTMAQALGLVVLGMLVMYGYALQHASTLTRVDAELKTQVAQERDRLVMLGAQYLPQGGSKLLEDEVARLESLAARREELLRTLQTGAGGDTAGFSELLAALARQAIPGVWLTGFATNGGADTATIKGRVLSADLVPAYLRALNREPTMSGRQVTELKLAAREQPAAEKAAQGEAGKPSATGPSKFVEFTVTAPRRAATAAKDAAKPSAVQRKGAT